MKRRIATASLALCALASLSSAQAIEPVGNVSGRKTTSLDGKWRAIVDPFEYGYYTIRLEPRAEGSRDAYFTDAAPRDRSDRVEYDFDRSESLDVPGDWNSQRERLLLYEGTVWYKRTFDYGLPAGARLFVHFGAANYEAIVYLNGRKVGSHVGGFTPFTFEITDRVRPAGNVLIVKVDNKRRRDGVPTLNSDWWNYGGLTRGVTLVETPGTFVQDYFLQLDPADPTQIAGWVKVAGVTSPRRVQVEIPAAGVSHAADTDASGMARVRIPARLTLWTPEQPTLYEVVVSSGDDRVRDLIGFRTIRTRGTSILLNGRPIFLRGISIHEEAPFRAGRAHSVEDARTLLGWAKEMGCNFVRLAHYPHNETIVREADRLGLLVWSETPVYWAIEWENASTLANASAQLAESIARDKNRAAVILWSVANETPDLPARLAFLRKLIADVRSMDATRLVTAAMLTHNQESSQSGRTLVIDDPLGADLDVLGCNQYIGWYTGLPEQIDRTAWRSDYDKPLVMSEFGADALFGLHGDALTRWTEEYQEDLYRRQVRMLDRIPFLAGASPWILMDFRSPRRTLPGIQDFFNRKGLVAITGQKKKAFYVMQEYYASRRGDRPPAEK